MGWVFAGYQSCIPFIFQYVNVFGFSLHCFSLSAILLVGRWMFSHLLWVCHCELCLGSGGHQGMDLISVDDGVYCYFEHISLLVSCRPASILKSVRLRLQFIVTNHPIIAACCQCICVLLLFSYLSWHTGPASRLRYRASVIAMLL